MKKGKSVKLNLYSPIKSIYGTVDSKNLKSIYINIQSWVCPKKEHDNWNRVVCNLNREIKHSVFNSISQTVFMDRSIVAWNPGRMSKPRTELTTSETVALVDAYVCI